MIAKYFLFLCLWLTCSAWGSIIHSSSGYTYDANGNTLTKTDNGNTVSYVYNKQNKLTGVTENGVTTTFSYNPNGLRIGKKTGTDEINYLIDAQSGFGDVVAEYQNSSKTTTYTLGNRRISQSQNGQTHYFGTDNQGSVKFLTDRTGLTDDYSYDSFGVLKNQNGSTDNAFRYTGEQFDKTLNMYNLRARYYAPEIGRFYGLDTYQGQLSDPESLHKYLYTANDPVNMVDPSGQFTMSFGGFSMGLSLPAITISTGTLAKLTLATIVVYGLNQINHEMDLLFYETDAEASRAAERQADYDAIKKKCDNPPSHWLNSCSAISRQIDHTKWCVKKFKEWDLKWLLGRHAEKIENWLRRIERLKDEYNRKCTNFTNG